MKELKILTYSEIDREEWNAFVKGSATGTWFQTPEAYGFYEGLPELFRPFVVAVKSEEVRGKSQQLRGVCVGYVTVEKSGVKQFFTRRAIIIGGPAFADDCSDDEAYALMQAVRLQFKISSFKFQIFDAPIYIETRNFNDYSRWKDAFEKAGFDYKPHLNFHVDCTDKEKLWERLSENRKRQIRKAQAAIECLANERVNEEEIRAWYEILKQLYRTKVKTPLWPVEFFIEAYRQGIGKFLFIKHKGKIIGGSMVVADERTVYEWFECGMNNEYKEQYPSVMATYAGMEFAHEQGCHRYDMMGAGEPGVPYGVRDFKSEFGGEMVEQGRFLCVCKPLLYKIGTMGVKILKGRKK